MGKKKRSGGGFGLGSINPKRLLIAAAAGAGLMLLAAKYAPQVDGRLAAIGGGLLAGGPIGAVAGYGAHMLLTQGTASAGASSGSLLF